ncbi:MAG: diguanylate cyclase domain-containing protein [Acidimicrobiales bacterium]
MHYKEGRATPETMATVLRIVGVLYVTFPVYLAAIYLYGTPTINWGGTAVEYVLLAVLLLAAAVDVRRIRNRSWERFGPWFAWIQICVGLALAATINATAAGDPDVYRVLLLLPAITAAMIGAEDMIASTWLLTMVALGVITYRQTGSDATTFWYVAVWGAALAGAVVSIHLVVGRFLAGMRVSDALRRVAEHEVADASWPESLAPCLPDIAVALEAERVAAVAYRSAVGLALLAVWPPGDWQRPLEATEATGALERGRPIRVGDRLVIPVATTVEPRIVLVAERSGPRRPFGGDGQRGTAATVAGLVAGLADRATLVTGLEREARLDPLTGLANRRALDESLNRELATHDRSGLALSVVMIDVDHFKAYNDAFGHLAGDTLLRRFADRLTGRTRQSDLVARYGGEEFCMVLPATTADNAEILIEELRGVGPVTDDTGRGVTFSAGIAQWDRSEPVGALLGRADHALYAAKGSGRNRICVAA